MTHLVEKHLQNNKGRGVITFSPEQIAEFERMNNPNRQKSETVQNNQSVKQSRQKLKIASENTYEKRKTRKYLDLLGKKGREREEEVRKLKSSPWYSRMPLVNTDPSGGYHAYNAEQFFKDQTGEEMPVLLRPTASDNIRTGMVAPMTLGTVSGLGQPMAFLSSLGGGLIGGGMWDLGSRILTDKSWADNVSQWTGMPKDLAAASNLGMLVGGAAGPYRARVSIYNNKNPFGYGNSLSDTVEGMKPTMTEIKQGVIDWFHPFRSWKAKETPYWKAILLNDVNKNLPFMKDMTLGSTTEFRDMMFRKALRLPENKNGTVFVDNGDGTVGLNMDKVNAIRRQWGGSDYDGTMKVLDGTTQKIAPHTYSFVSGDNIVGVGGYTSGKSFFDPIGGEMTGTMTDVWDIQPFSDSRTIWKWGTQHLPWLRKWEAMTSFGGETPTVKITIPNMKPMLISNVIPKRINTTQHKQYNL